MLAHQVVLPTPSLFLRLPNYSPSTTTNRAASILRTLFQVPYTVSPLLATLMKTAGCTPTIPIPVPATHRSPLYSSPFLSHSCALFCSLLHFLALTKNSTVLFSCDSVLFAQNTGGGGIPTSLTSPENLLFLFARPTMNMNLHLRGPAMPEARARVPGIDLKEIDDVILGCAMPEGEQGMNVARIAALRAGLPVETSANALGGGTESMSLVPMGGNKVSPNPWLVDHYPDTYINMGLGTENIARKFGITREQADAFSANSHKKALAAIAAGNFKDETIPVEVKITSLPTNGNGASSKSKSSPAKPTTQTFLFDTDELPRADTSLEVLAKLKPAFHAKGTVTAGNSSPMSDGAAATVVMSDARAKALGLKPLARFVAYATAGCPPEEFGIGPVFAIPKALKLAGLSLSDIAVIELNEAFAAQSLAVIQQAGLDAARVNPNGGAIALGHPLGCTGAKLTATLIRDLQRKDARYGMVTMCIGGGMGAAGIFERLT